MAAPRYTVFRATATDLNAARTAMLDLLSGKSAMTRRYEHFLDYEACHLILAIADDRRVVGGLVGYRLRKQIV